MSKNLGHEKLNTLRVKLCNMRLLIIDEISLMGSNELKRMQELAKPGDVKFVSRAIDKVMGNPCATSKARALYSLADFSTNKTYGLPQMVEIQLNIKYMITANIEVADGLFNGACGLLKFIEPSQNNNIQIVWIKFNDRSIGASARSSRKNISDSN